MLGLVPRHQPRGDIHFWRTPNGRRITIQDQGKEVGRAYIYLMHNDLHEQPFGLIEDVFVEQVYLGQGMGPALVKRAIELTKEANCYKLIATSRTSRPQVHDLYKQLGLTQHGVEFRLKV
ncbi:MAG: GNAT family N-acetyltransferase [Cyanobacteria bacterium P01_D01_bin.71]